MKHCLFFTSILVTLSLLMVPESSFARRTHMTPEERTHLEKAKTVLVTVLALTEKGASDATDLTKIVTQGLGDIGYEVVTDRTKAHDVEFKVKCEERKTWTGTTPEGGDAELADAPSRLWNGPACLFTYLLNGKNLGWYKEVRTPFQDSITAAKIAGAKDPGLFALEQLTTQVSNYDFPVLIAAEWGQPQRLVKLLEAPNTPKLRKLKILSTLSMHEADLALPQITELVKQKDLAQEAIAALKGVGEDSIPTLIDLFQNSPQPEIQAAAAEALGDVAGASGNPTAIPPLIAYLKRALSTMKTSEDINFPVLTPVVWSLGKLRDEKAIAPMTELNKKVWLIYDKSKEMADLREAANWTYKQLDLDGHVS
ncbi:HEAT repeat domain-containing protein [Candidatus Nitronereus thalassa]|uniref:HEAT repeat domain-containing protein n=1 Tax=Candidatus Nitronereus thalassa TaxID=3020898 RepID=A0ABU3KBT4_9BACT|nr:HEAT repeat domain-containing protein [Candidatus Nitronereus thalassa]MDT7043970.1 HEAT repeat domain-containing protein [Candidatus Nitronereus thalassa]